MDHAVRVARIHPGLRRLAAAVPVARYQAEAGLDIYCLAMCSDDLRQTEQSCVFSCGHRLRTLTLAGLLCANADRTACAASILDRDLCHCNAGRIWSLAAARQSVGTVGVGDIAFRRPV